MSKPSHDAKGAKTVSIPFSAPKQEKATMAAKTAPPTGPNSARPKSRATVLLSPTVAYVRGRMSKIVRTDLGKAYLVQDGEVRDVR